MAPKKKIKVVEDSPVPTFTESIPSPVSSPVGEVLITVRAKQPFQDGAFTPVFLKYGYKPYWKEGEVRRIPVDLFDKLNSRSGGKFETFEPKH